MDIEVLGNTLTVKATLEVPTASNLSASRKNHVLVSTHGYVPIEGTDMKINVNVIKHV